jgi:hypothetical protein
VAARLYSNIDTSIWGNGVLILSGIRSGAVTCASPATTPTATSTG